MSGRLSADQALAQPEQRSADGAWHDGSPYLAENRPAAQIVDTGKDALLRIFHTGDNLGQTTPDITGGFPRSFLVQCNALRVLIR